MRPEAYEAWINLYAAVGLLGSIRAACAMAKTIWDIRTGHLPLEAGTFRQKILLLPKIWAHWQISYFLGFPCIMAICGLYVHYIGIDAFNPS